MMTHVRVMHADSPHLMIQCNLQGCKKTFKTFTVNRNHVYCFHNATTLNKVTQQEEGDLALLQHTPPATHYDDDDDSDNDGGSLGTLCYISSHALL